MVAAKQEPLEKVEVYIARIIRLARKAAASQEQILFGITNGLLTHIRQHVLTKSCQSVEDIRRCSLIAETASPDTEDTALLLRHLEAKFEALPAQPLLPTYIPQPPEQTYFLQYSQPFVRPSFSAEYRPNVRPQYQQFENSQSGDSNSITLSCRYCGFSHILGRINCPASQQSCRLCQKPGHFERVCR